MRNFAIGRMEYWRLHAFVLMNNHDDLFVETPQANLSAGMQFLNGAYTSYFNRRYRRAGHLFQGRYKAQLVEEQGYGLEVSRYVHLNPVRARCVERPELGELRSKPSLETIREVVAEEFGVDGSDWAQGRRSNNVSRAVAECRWRRAGDWARRGGWFALWENGASIGKTPY